LSFHSVFRDRVNPGEVPNPIPHELAHKDFRPPTLREQIQTAIRSEFSIQAEANGLDTFEEANDFELDDEDADPLTIYEQVLMVPETEETLDGEETSPPAAGDIPPETEHTPPSLAKSPVVGPNPTPEPETAPEGSERPLILPRSR